MNRFTSYIQGRHVSATAPKDGHSFVFNKATGEYDVKFDGQRVLLPVRLVRESALPAFTHSNGVLTASANGAFPSTDSVTPALNDEIVVVGETGANKKYNGPYKLTDAGSAGTPWVLTRRSDANENHEFQPGMLIGVMEGTLNAGTVWQFSNTTEPVLGTTDLGFRKASGSGGVPGGANREIQYNNNGVFGGSARYKFLDDGVTFVLFDHADQVTLDRWTVDGLAHGFTDQAPTDTFFLIGVYNLATAGGVWLAGLAADTNPAWGQYGANIGASATLPVQRFSASKKSGADFAACAATDLMYEFANNESTPRLRIFGDGMVDFIKPDASAAMFRFRMTGLDHGITGIAPTDVWGVIQQSAAAGGVYVLGLGSNTGQVLYFDAINTGASTTVAPVHFNIAKKSGTGSAACAAGDLIFKIQNYATSALQLYGDGSMTLAGALTVQGNLTINGTTTTIDSTTLDVEDRVIHVNHTTGADTPVPTAICGVGVHRGASAGVARDHAAFLWDEANTRFILAWNTGGDDSTIGAQLALHALSFTGSGAGLTSLNAGSLSSGTVPTARLGSGTADSTTVLRGDSTWATFTSPPFSDGSAILKGSADATKLLRFEIDGFTTGTTREIIVPNADDTMAVLAAAQTFTNKTLTSPKIGTGIYDTNGNELFLLTATASAVNELTYNNAATGANPTWASTGGDANIGQDFKMKGTGAVRILNATGDDVLHFQASNATLRVGKSGVTGGIITIDSGGSMRNWAAQGGIEFINSGAGAYKPIAADFFESVSAGTLTAPAYRFRDETALGFYRVGSSEIGATGEIFTVGKTNALARIRGRGFYTANPSDPPDDQWDLQVIDTGATVVLRCRYRDVSAASTKTGDIPLA